MRRKTEIKHLILKDLKRTGKLNQYLSEIILKLVLSCFIIFCIFSFYILMNAEFQLLFLEVVNICFNGYIFLCLFVKI